MKIRGKRRRSAAILLALGAAGSAACASRRPRARPAAPEAGSVRPSGPGARLERAYQDIRRRRWKDAVALLDAAIDEDPANARLRMERGYARQALGELSAAADDFASVSLAPGEFQEQARAALKELDRESSDSARAARVEALLDAGYDALRRGENAAAREDFQAALAADPGRADVVKQLGYMSLADGDTAAAAADFAGVRRLAPGDAAAALQLGYMYDGLHNETAAENAFAAAASSPDPKVRDAAEAALSRVRAAGQPVFLDVYGSPYDSSRFANKLAYFEAALGYKPARDSPVVFFFGGRYAQDARSRGGVAPEVYSDNVLSAGPGVRLQPRGWNASLTAEEDGSLNLIRSPAHPRDTEADGRVVASDYAYRDGPLRTFADAGGSAGYYSRYRNNEIGLLQLRAGERLWDGPDARVLLYAPFNVVKDVNRDFYNNLCEYGAGVELQPLTRLNFKLRAEYLRGVYMGITGADPNPYGRVYTDLRVMLVFSARFTPPPNAPDPFIPTRPPSFRW